MNKKIEIFPIKKIYMEEVIELLGSISKFKTNEDDYDLIWDEYKNQPNVFSLIAKIDKNLVGFGAIIIETKIRGGKLGHIEDIVTHKNFRNLGVGKAILDSLYNIAVKKECYQIALACKENNIPFYKKCNYKLHGYYMQRFINNN